MTGTMTIGALGGDGSFTAYLAEPEGTPIAAIVVIQEIFGVNAGIRRKADTLAEAGYLAIAPDLFWRIEPKLELDPDVPHEMQKGMELFGKFDADQGIKDIEATIRAARERLGKGADGKVGAVGYCLGGKLAYMTAARTDVNATVGYYAVGIPELLHEQHAIAHPMMLHIAGADGFVTPDQQQAMHEGLDDNPKVTLHDYAGAVHGFATEFGQRRKADAAELADARTAAFFAEHLA